MENAKASAKKFMLNYGILLGIFSVLFNVILYATNNHIQPHWSLSLFGFLIFIAVVVMAHKAFKKENGGFMKLGEAIKIGLGIALISAIIGVIYTYLLMNVIEPTYMDQVMEIQQETMLERNPDMTQEQIDTAIEMSQKFSGTGMVVAFQLIGGLFFGFIISLVSGLVMKKENPYENA
jgi:hypothetical protein